MRNDPVQVFDIESQAYYPEPGYNPVDQRLRRSFRDATTGISSPSAEDIRRHAYPITNMLYDAKLTGSITLRGREILKESYVRAVDHRYAPPERNLKAYEQLSIYLKLACEDGERPLQVRYVPKKFLTGYYKKSASWRLERADGSLITSRNTFTKIREIALEMVDNPQFLTEPVRGPRVPFSYVDTHSIVGPIFQRIKKA